MALVKGTESGDHGIENDRQSSLLNHARAAHAAGLCVLPPAQDGSKRPDAGSWVQYQTVCSTAEEIYDWYASGQRSGLGLVCGSVSGHLELFEFDDAEIYQQFLARAEESDLAPLVQKVAEGYEEATPGGGIHWLYRVEGGEAQTTRLASRLGANSFAHARPYPLIETKGEGGYVITAPSNGKVHPSGGAYRLQRGGLFTISVLSHEERDALWALARSFDETAISDTSIHDSAVRADSRWLVRPGDAFNEKVSWEEILTPHGWLPVRRKGGETFWRRPGGYPNGWGASTNYGGTNLLHVWTTAAPPLHPATNYTKFGAYSLLNHAGNFVDAAKALEYQGYGTRKPAPSSAGLASYLTAIDSSLEECTISNHLVPVPPFPIHALPPAARDYVQWGASALGCPVDFIAPHLLTLCGAAAGNSRTLHIKDGFELFPIFWTCVVGKPGTAKSPALSFVRRLLEAVQDAAWEKWRAAHADWKGRPPAERGAPPIPESYFVTDTTTEAVALALTASRGLAVIHDELAGWVKSYDAYKKSGGDRQSWLSSWSGSPLRPNRKSGDPIYITNPVVSVTGGIQPDVLPSLTGEAKRDDGFIPRLLIAWPDAEPQNWSDAVVPDAVLALMAGIVAKLRLPSGKTAVSTLSPEAYAGWKDWFNENHRRTSETAGLEAGWLAKAPLHLGRIALVLHMVTCPDEPEQPLSSGTLQDAIAILGYFQGHLARVLPAFGQPVALGGADISSRIHRILSTSSGQRAGRSELSRRLGRRVSAEEITAGLHQLEERGLVEQRLVPTGGRPREEWCLIDQSLEERLHIDE